MTRRRSAAMSCVLAVAGALAVAACASPGSQPVSGADAVAAMEDSTSVAETTTTASAAAPAGDVPPGEDEQLLTWLYTLLDVGTRAEMTSSFTANVSEQVIAECMTGAGFQYIEGPSAEDQVASDLRYTLPADEYAARYGLGITGWELGLFPPLPPDPNDEYVSSLSESQRAAFFQTRMECWRGNDPEAPARSDALTVSIEEFRGIVATDARTVEALQTWQECMAAAGYTYASPLAMQQSFYTRMNEDLRRDSLEQLHNEEVAVAVANVPCVAAYTAEYRAAVLDRFTEFKRLYETALASGAAPDAQG